MAGTPSSGTITFTDVASTQLGFTTPYNMSNMYAVANTGGQSGLMYHNLNMAPGNATTAKVAIYDPYNALSNEKLTNWYNYFQDISMVMTYLVTNNSNYNVNINISLWDSTNITRGTIFNGLVNANSNTGTQTVSTGLLSQNANITSGYRVAIDGVTFSPGPGPGQTYSITLTVASTSDTDGVGASTTRTSYSLGGYTESGPPAPPPTPYAARKAVDSSGGTIPCNKRTTVSITIT